MIYKFPLEPKKYASNRRQGIVYTRPEIVALSLDLVGYQIGPSLLKKTILDIGCGYGQFLAEAAHRLSSSCRKAGLSFCEAAEVVASRIQGVEIDPVTAIAASKNAFMAMASAYGVADNIDWATTSGIVRTADFLEWSGRKFDFIIGNLPYVKYELINQLPGRKGLDWIHDNFKCFRGRADYSIAFVEKALQLLSEEGAIGVITSNRFAQSEYGKNLRIMLANGHLQLDELDFSDVNAFEEDVTAYASLFVVARGRPRTSHYVRLRSIDSEGLGRLSRIGLARARSTRWYTGCSRGALPRDGSAWPPLPGQAISILKRLERRFPALDDAGFVVRTGPATGANDVFVRSHDEFPLTIDTKKRYLLPLCSSRSGGPTSSKSKNQYLLSVYETRTKRLLELDELPDDMQDYLLVNRCELEARYIVRNSLKEWWSTIDSYDPGIMRKHKVLIPDLKHGRGVRFDWGHLFPDHTVIYVTGSSRESRKLTAVLRSPVVDLIRLWKSPVMRGGVPRASANVVSRLPCPDLDCIDISEVTEDRFSQVFDAYGLSSSEISRIKSIHSAMVDAS